MDNSQKAARVYNQIAPAYADEFSKISDHLKDFLSLLPPGGNILDVGCGHGVDSGFLASKGHTVIGIDLSAAMLKIARNNFPQIDFRLEDIRKLNFTKNQFDGIIASCSLIHLPKKDIPQTLRQLALFLKPKGFIYIQLQSGKSEEIFVDEPFKPGEKLFLNIISVSEIKKLLADAGFKIIHQFQRRPKSKSELSYTKLFTIAQILK